MKFLWIDEWQPIDTAPDGVEIILAWTTGDHWRKGENAECGWVWTSGTRRFTSCEARVRK